MKTKTTILLLITLLTLSCNNTFDKISDNKFIGLWEVQGADVTEGIQLKIQRENGKLVGRVYKLNDNKFVKLFVDGNEVFVAGIERKSNYQFKLTENKIGKELFSLYGQKTSQEFEVQFIDDNTIGLALENSNPLQSTRIYKKVK
jgi:hypothetical protein